jgi:hypothetical protein
MNGRFFIAYDKGASVFLRCPNDVRRWLKLPAKIPMRESYDSWIASLEAADAKPSPNLLPIRSSGELDPSDPNYQSKTVI